MAFKRSVYNIATRVYFKRRANGGVKVGISCGVYQLFNVLSRIRDLHSSFQSLSEERYKALRARF